MSEATNPLPAGESRLGAEMRPAWRLALEGFFRIPSAHEAVARWHVAPALDMAAYHFSWLWLLVPLLAAGDQHPTDYVPCLVLVLALNFVHRHFTLPLVYLDGEVFARHRRIFGLAPLLVLAALLASPALLHDDLPAGALRWAGLDWPAEPLRLRLVLSTILFVAGVWTIWHTLMQKFGILRLYDAKARRLGEAGVPGWVDRLFVLGWLPLYVVYLGTRYGDVAVQNLRGVREFVGPLTRALAAAEWILLPAAALLATAAVACFVVAEWRTSRLRNPARGSMALGMLGISVSFLLFNPIKVYLAFAFSHALEYIVFVWAFGRRRYRAPLPHRPLLGRIHRRAAIAYPAFALGTAAVYFLGKSWAKYDAEFWSLPTLELAGIDVSVWLYLYAVYQSMLHFCFDGVLWKARQPVVRDSF